MECRAVSFATRPALFFLFFLFFSDGTRRDFQRKRIGVARRRTIAAASRRSARRAVLRSRARTVSTTRSASSTQTYRSIAVFLVRTLGEISPSFVAEGNARTKTGPSRVVAPLAPRESSQSLLPVSVGSRQRVLRQSIAPCVMWFPTVRGRAGRGFLVPGLDHQRRAVGVFLQRVVAASSAGAPWRCCTCLRAHPWSRRGYLLPYGLRCPSSASSTAEVF